LKPSIPSANPLVAPLADTAAGCVALDWGTTNLRAYLLDADGAVIEQRERPWGILSLPAPADAGVFDQALDGIAADWLAARPDAPLIASGMVGSAQCWRQAPYIGAPATAVELARGLTVVDTAGARALHIVPGLLQNRADALPDVIRGEETQVIGALESAAAQEESVCYVLPGTHSKWVLVRNRCIDRFTTCMTGEVFATLKQHSILGRLMQPAPESAAAESAAAFAQAVALARDSGPGDLMRHLFTVRSMNLAGRLPVTALADYLSGLLIGHELTSATHWLRRQAGGLPPIVLIGEQALLERYHAAFAAFEIRATHLGNTAAAGLHRLINLARLR
jgi:2-dehydro-3-deoxygalactonokinase